MSSETAAGEARRYLRHVGVDYDLPARGAPAGGVMGWEMCFFFLPNSL